MFGYIRLVALMCIAGYAAGRFDLDVGKGVCNGGKCSQCSPVVFHAEQTLLVAMNKLTANLNNLQNRLVANIGSMNHSVSSVSLSITKTLHVVSNAVREVNVEIIEQINALLQYVHNYDRSDLDRIKVLVHAIKQMQNVIHQSSNNLIAIANQIILFHGKLVEGVDSAVSNVLSRISNTRQILLQISQSLLAYIAKLDELLSASHSIKVSLTGLDALITDIKQTLVSSISFQQSVLNMLQDLIGQQKEHLNYIRSEISSVSISANKIIQSIGIATAEVGNYKGILLQILEHTKSMNAVVASYEDQLRKYHSQIAELTNKIASIMAMFNKAQLSVQNANVEIQALINQQIKLQDEMTALLQILDKEEQHLMLSIKRARELISSILVKVNEVRSNEVSNQNKRVAMVQSINADVTSVKATVTSNSQVATALSAITNTLEKRMGQIMEYIKEIQKQCSIFPTSPPAALCEGPGYNDCVVGKVCGSDGKTYNSECDMKKVACIMRTVIKLVHTGGCRPAVITTPAPQCHFTCEPILDPVCGSDGVTYSCACSMKLTACHTDRQITVVKKGPCESEPTTASLVSNCQFSCNAIDPVCGSDGNTYSSLCHMLEAACNDKKVITKDHDGKCGGQCPKDWVEINGRCFFVHKPSFSSSHSFDTANRDCVSRGGHLAQFSSDLEWKSVQQFLLNASQGHNIHDHYYWVACKFVNRWYWYGYHNLYVDLRYAWYNNYHPTVPYGKVSCGALAGKHVFKMVAIECSGFSYKQFGWICMKQS